MHWYSPLNYIKTVCFSAFVDLHKKLSKTFLNVFILSLLSRIQRKHGLFTSSCRGQCFSRGRIRSNSTRIRNYLSIAGKRGQNCAQSPCDEIAPYALSDNTFAKKLQTIKIHLTFIQNATEIKDCHLIQLAKNCLLKRIRKNLFYYLLLLLFDLKLSRGNQLLLEYQMIISE